MEHIVPVSYTHLNTQKLDEIISDLNGFNFETDELELTGRAKRDQYESPWGSCYFVFKSRGYENKGDGYFDQ